MLKLQKKKEVKKNMIQMLKYVEKYMLNFWLGNDMLKCAKSWDVEILYKMLNFCWLLLNLEFISSFI